MIISEIFVTVVTSLPYGAYAFHQLLQSIQKRIVIFNPKQSVWFLLFIRMTIYFEPSCGFYIYLMTLTALRKRFYKMFIGNLLTAYHCCSKNDGIAE
jgi:hypothetical protein